MGPEASRDDSQSADEYVERSAQSDIHALECPDGDVYPIDYVKTCVDIIMW